MSLPARFRSWLRAMTARPRLESEMETEFRFHMESYIDDLVRKGVPAEEAMRRARLEFGGVESHKDGIRLSLGLRMWDELRADVRYGLRMLRKSPGFTAVAVVSLGLGIGTNTAIFTLTKEALLDRLPVPRPDQLRLLTWTENDKGVVQSMWGDFDNTPGGLATSSSFSYPVYQELKRQNNALQGLFAFKRINRITATIDGQAEVVNGELVSGNYYRELGARTVIGRTIAPPDDSAPGQGTVAVISDRFWTRRFNRAPEVVGKTINLNLSPVTIIGVNEPGFTGAASVQDGPDVFLPFSMQPVVAPRMRGLLLTDNNLWWVQIMGRLKPGVSERSARAMLDTALDRAVHATMASSLVKDAQVPHLELGPGSRGLNHSGKQFAQPITVLSCLAGFVLLLACANLANLLLARSAARRREMSVRLALGAGQGRILRQVFTESMLLAMLGGGAGLLFGFMGRSIIPHLLSSAWEPVAFESPFDWRVLAFTAAVALVTGLLFGIAPAWQATRTDVNSGLKDGAKTASSRRTGLAGKAIVAFQMSVSMLLVVGAGLFIRTLVNLNSTDPGFQPKQVLLFSISPPKARPGPVDIAMLRLIEEKLEAVPGVESVALSSEPLVAHSESNDSFTPDDQPRNAGKKQTAHMNAVSEHFFPTMRIPLLYGRDFGAQDTETSPGVAIVNRRLTEKFYAGENPIGRTFTTSARQHIQIVGVCTDTKYGDLRREAPPTFFTLYRQEKDAEGGMTYELRTRGDPASIVPLVRKVVQSVNQDVPLIDVRTQVEQIDATLIQERVFATLSGSFGFLALTLACIGIYGIMAYTVARRTGEFGIRLALGAQAHRLLTMVLRESGTMAAVGIGTGLIAALFLTRFLGKMLFGLKPSDPLTLAGAAGLLIVVALSAAWSPARRASKVQPMEALRHE